MVAISIVIVSWNVREHLRRCLASIVRARGDVALEVFIVDNASTDGSREAMSNVKCQMSNVYFIENEVNRGFAAANNQALAQAKGEYILLLNPDTELTSDSADPLRRHAPVSGNIAVLGGGCPSTELQRNGATKHSGFPSPALGDSSIDTFATVRVGDTADPLVLKTLLHFMQTHPRCGILGSKLLNPDGTLQPSVRRFPDAWSPIALSLGFQAKRYMAFDFDYTKAQQVDQVMGACFLIRRACMEAIGVFDEQFFIWFEEVDYCKRAKDAGWEVWYTPDARIVHHGGESFAQVLTTKKQWMYSRSLLQYFVKQKQWGAFFLNAVAIPCRLFFSIIFEIASLRSQ